PLAFREQFLRAPGEPFQVVLEGSLDSVWHRPRWLGLLFRALAALGILLPYEGRGVPTRLVVGTGRLPTSAPYHVWDRYVHFERSGRPVRFRTKILYDADLDEVVDLVGPRDALYMVWYARFHPPTDLTLATAAVALDLGGRRWWLPGWLWRWTLGTVRFLQRAESVGSDAIRISIRIAHPLFGDIFGYDGAFRARRVTEAPVEAEGVALGVAA
ncbi:MAG TPA: DUF4166 domain-containing protein, partial [Chloroflexota bacterium]|nr:DUF4166 domain-containing protein [Chloroflexota bacterium]